MDPPSETSLFTVAPSPQTPLLRFFLGGGGGCTPGGAFGYFLGGYVPPGTPNWHPVLKKNSPKIDTPF